MLWLILSSSLFSVYTRGMTLSKTQGGSKNVIYWEEILNPIPTPSMHLTNTNLKIGCQKLTTILPSGRKFRNNLVIKQNHIRDALLCVNYAIGEIVFKLPSTALYSFLQLKMFSFTQTQRVDRYWSNYVSVLWTMHSNLYFVQVLKARKFNVSLLWTLLYWKFLFCPDCVGNPSYSSTKGVWLKSSA